MIPGTVELSVLELSVSGEPFVPTPVTPPLPLPLDDAAEPVYLVEASAYEGEGVEAELEPTEFAVEESIFATVPEIMSPDVIQTLRWSDRGWISGEADTPAHTPYYGRLVSPLTIDRAVPLTPEAGSRMSLSLGEVIIANQDGAEDGVLSLAIDGQQIVVKRGDYADAYADFVTVFSGRGVYWRLSNENLFIGIRDNSYLLDVPLSSLYGGAGDADGTSENAGQPKPQTYGIVRNIRPILINPTSLIYQIHDGAIESIDAVYDRGAALAATSNYATYAALAAATVAANSYATCLAEGYLRLGSSPAGLVTCDAHGDSTGGYTSNASYIARRIILRTQVESSGLDEDSFEYTASEFPAPCGYYFTEALTVGEAIDNVCDGAFLWIGQRRTGELMLGRARAPTMPLYDIGTTEILGEVERLQLPDSISPCNWRRRVGYQRNWTVQRGEDLAGSVTDARRQFLAEQFRIAAAADTTRRTRNQLATDPAPVPTAFDVLSDAEALAQNMLDLFTVERRLLRFTIPLGAHVLDLDDDIRLTWPRYGLDAGVDLKIFGISENVEAGTMTLTVFG